MSEGREATKQVQEAAVVAAGLFGAMVALVVGVAWAGGYPDFGTDWLLTGVLPTYVALTLLGTVVMSGSEITEVVRGAF